MFRLRKIFARMPGKHILHNVLFWLCVCCLICIRNMFTQVVRCFTIVKHVIGKTFLSSIIFITENVVILAFSASILPVMSKEFKLPCGTIEKHLEKG